MKKISCIIIDDEKNSAKMLQSLLAHFCPHVEVLALIHKPADAVEWLTNHDDPQVVFLDIEMPGMNGFQLLDAIPRITSNVIFTTAYEQFAIRAFKTKAISYLLKPIDGIELQAAVEKAEKQIGTNVSARIERIEAALQEIKSQSHKLSKVSVSTADGVLLVETSKIVRLEADSNYTHIHMDGGKKLTCSKTLKEYDDALCGRGFFRIHHAHIVNLGFVERYIRGEGGYVVTTDQTTLEVSRRKKAELLEAIRLLK